MHLRNLTRWLALIAAIAVAALIVKLTEQSNLKLNGGAGPTLFPI